MQVISISEVVSLLRQRRSGKKFIVEFLNQCEWIDAIPLTEIEKAREEIKELSQLGLLVDKSEVLNIFDTLIAESEEQ